MSLSFALSNAYTGLTATSRQAEVTANNIANVNTEGYARRVVNLDAQVIDGRGSGVLVQGVTVATANVLTAERRRAETDLAGQQVTADVATTLSRVIGGPDEPGSLFERYDAFENSLRAFSGDPAATHLQVDTLTKAKDLVLGFQEAEEQLQAARLDIDAEIEREVTQLNALLQEIHQLNKDSQRSTVQGIDATEATARRELLIDQVVDLTGAKVIPRQDGRVFLTTDTGFPLVTDSPTTFDFTQATTVSATMDLIGGAPGALSGLEVDGMDITPPATTPATLTDGKIAALFQARDVDMVTVQTQLDALATDLVDRFSDPTTDPTLAGAVGLFTEAGALPTGTAGIAGQLALNTAVDPDQGGDLWRLRDGIGAVAEGDAGDNTQVVRMLDALTTERATPAGSGVTGTKSATGLIAAVGSIIASDAQSAEGLLTMRAARHESLYLQEGRAIGVDLDKELQDLTTIQNAYAANARVMEVVNSLFDRLLQI